MAEYFAEDKSIRAAIVTHDNIYVPDWSRVAERYSALTAGALAVIKFLAVKPSKVIEPIIPGRTDPGATNCVSNQSNRVHDRTAFCTRLAVLHPSVLLVS